MLLGKFFTAKTLVFLCAISACPLRLCSENPPPTPRDAAVDILHGISIPDPYRWLENQTSPQTRAWIDAQNAYTHSLLDRYPGRDRIKQRLTSLMKIDQTGVPVARRGRYFFLHRAAAQDQPVLYLRRGLTGKDEVLVDPNPLSPDHTTSVSLLDVSTDGTLLAYGIRRGGEDETTVHLLNVDTQKELPDALPRGRYQIALKPDHSGFYYSRYLKEGDRIFYHAMGRPVASDPKIFGDGYSPEMGIGATVSENGHWLLIEVVYGSAAERGELWLSDLKAASPIAAVVKDRPARFHGEIGGDTLFIHTNWNAPNGRIMAAPASSPAPDRWREIVPEARDAIEDIAPAGGNIVVRYLHDAAASLSVFDPAGKRVRDIASPAGIGSAGAVSGDWNSPELFFEYNFFQIPNTIYRYDLSTAAESVWWRANAPVDSARLEVRQVWYASKDGTRIPMFLLQRKGLELDGARPVLLTGYGGFNISETPRFSPQAVVWAESGGVFALPNLRGGGEFGEAWHKAGMLGKKQNVFDDFTAAAEWLIRNHYTNPSKLAIEGRSNGGLLVGAALTERPDLFQAVVCGYPLLDMLRYQKFLVAKWWVPEYGSSDDARQFKYLYAYSPYHHVKKGVKYPAVLFVTGDADTRVAPLHARKMTALLQASTASDRPILLRYDTEAGHSAGLPVSKRIDDATDELSFLFWQLAIKPI